jgi:hypothetical protein
VVIVLAAFLHILSLPPAAKGEPMRSRARSIAAVFALLFLLALIPASGGSQNSPPTDAQSQAQTKNDVVYVCACLKTKSCSCMTEAKMEGPCACGTKGGPPLLPVPRNSAWAKYNRKALGK